MIGRPWRRRRGARSSPAPSAILAAGTVAGTAVISAGSAGAGRGECGLCAAGRPGKGRHGMEWRAMGWGRADPLPLLPLGSIWGAARGGRVASRTRRECGAGAAPRPGGPAGLLEGRRRPGQPGKERGLHGVRSVPAAVARGGRAERMRRGSAPRYGRAGAGPAAARSRWRRGKAAWKCRAGVGLAAWGEAGRERPCPPQRRPEPGLRSRASPQLRGSAGASRRSLFRPQPAGPSAVVPASSRTRRPPLSRSPPAGNSSPAAPWACPGPCPGPCPVPRGALASLGAPGPRSPPTPRPDAGEEAGLERWADADQER